MSRADVFRASGPTSGSNVRIKLGAKKDGTIVAAQGTYWLQAGAFPGSPIRGAAGCAIEIAIDTKSVNTNHAERDKHLRSKDFLEVDKYAQATFKSTAYEGTADAGVLRTEQGHEFVVDNLDDLLAGLDALDDLVADGLLLHALDEVARDFEVHVGIEQREAHVAQRVADVGLGNLAEAAQVAEDVLELAGQRIKHGADSGNARGNCQPFCAAS